MCPCSVFGTGGTSECTPVPVFGTGGTSECTLLPVFRAREHPPKPPFWKQPFCEPPTLKLSRKIPSFSQNNVEHFLSGGYGIPKPQFWYPPLRFGSQLRMRKHLFFLVFWVYTVDFSFSVSRQKCVVVFLRCLSRKLRSQHQLPVKTLPSKKGVVNGGSMPS